MASTSQSIDSIIPLAVLRTPIIKVEEKKRHCVLRSRGFVSVNTFASEEQVSQALTEALGKYLSSNPLSKLIENPTGIGKCFAIQPKVDFVVHVLFDTPKGSPNGPCVHQGWVYIWCSCVELANLLIGKNEDGQDLPKSLMPIYLGYNTKRTKLGSRPMEFTRALTKIVQAWTYPLKSIETGHVVFQFTAMLDDEGLFRQVTVSKYQMAHIINYIEHVAGLFKNDDPDVWCEQADDQISLHVDYGQDEQDKHAAVLFLFFCPFISYRPSMTFDDDVLLKSHLKATGSYVR